MNVDDGPPLRYGHSKSFVSDFIWLQGVNDVTCPAEYRHRARALPVANSLLIADWLPTSYNGPMEIQGHIQNRLVVPEVTLGLPEGAKVTIVVPRLLRPRSTIR